MTDRPFLRVYILTAGPLIKRTGGPPTSQLSARSLSPSSTRSADESTLRKFESLFRRMGLPRAFAGVVPHQETLQLYSAFYVTRTHCDAPNWHADYAARAGTSALTLIAPLADYAETDSFQLTYLSRDRDACDSEGGEAEEEEWFAGDADADGARRRRYTYRKGRAIVFGSRFVHSTEPGAAKGGMEQRPQSSSTRPGLHSQPARPLITQQSCHWSQPPRVLAVSCSVGGQACRSAAFRALSAALLLVAAASASFFNDSSSNSRAPPRPVTSSPFSSLLSFSRRVNLGRFFIYRSEPRRSAFVVNTPAWGWGGQAAVGCDGERQSPWIARRHPACWPMSAMVWALRWALGWGE